MSVLCLKRWSVESNERDSDWERWMEEADRLYLRLLGRLQKSPFYYNEVCSVGVLASAAALAGFTPLMEFEHEKGDSKSNAWNGRADLRFWSDRGSYTLEAKRAFVHATEKNLSEMLKEAENDVCALGSRSEGFRVAMLIAYVAYPKYLDVYRCFAVSEHTSAAYRIGPDGENGAFLFFKSCEI